AEEKKKAAGSVEERLPLPAKILVLPGCTFRASKPAIFGVQLMAGRLKKGIRLMDRKGVIIGEVREIQKDGKPARETHVGEQLAISVEGAICGKSFEERSELLVYITRNEAAELVAGMGSSMPADEKLVLDEILGITDKKRF
ncbi:MAG: translation initiation factor IF-2, partial [Candidatus Micrarchaeota archaeon]|nr:translation initiation factor IF-2 [Candidatus Micrarchaeota archaeon]